MRKTYSLLFGLALAVAVTRLPAAEVVDGVVATVNGKVITYSELRDLVAPLEPQVRREYQGEELRKRLQNLQEDALNSLIDRALIVDEFKSKGYSFPENVVDQQLSEIIQQEFGGDRAALIKTLETRHMTLPQYREQIRDRTIVQAMRNRKTSQSIVASPYKIEKYYKDHIGDYKVEDQIKLRMIFIKKGEAAEGEDRRRKLGEEILGKLKAGAKFEELAKQYSEGKEAKLGGDWGWVGKDVLRKELNEVAFKLKAGENSGLIETAEGSYLLHVDEVKTAHTKPLPEVRDEIEKVILQEQRAKLQEAWVKELRAKAFIRTF